MRASFRRPRSSSRGRSGRRRSLVTIRRADLFWVDLTPATVVTMYLDPRINELLLPKLENLRRGTRMVSNTLDSSFCVEALEEALARFGQPEIFNTDQGAQFTSEAFTRPLRDRGIAISMDGKGRCLDNVFVERLWRSLKYEKPIS
jgi:hypothetical protein